jgi:hypothetical protein
MYAVTTVAAAQACDTTGALNLLNGVVPGTAVNERLGRAIELESLELHLQDTVTGGTGVDQFHRILIVADRQPNGAALAITDVLDSVSVVSPINLANRARFTILWDEFHHLNATAEAGSQKAFYLSKSMKNLRVIFNSGVAGTIADIATNSVYILTIGSVGAGATAGSCTYRARIYYHPVL